MKVEPLFIRVLNRNAGAIEIINSFIANSTDQISVDMAKEALLDPSDISLFIKDFREAIEDLIDNGVNQRFINYVNSYMKPSLCESVDTRGSGRAGESRFVFLKDAGSPWIEALVCYNVTIYMKAFGFGAIKKCATCNKFFTDKGKYAKYCSDICKLQKA